MGEDQLSAEAGSPIESRSIGGRGSDMANRATPFLENHWYVAAWAGEIGAAPLARTILGRRIVLYRDAAGAVAALADRCPHRSYPLSRGEVKGDRIVCGYHGIEFGRDGRCALVPSTGTAPGALRVRAYPVVEQGPFVWIWMGDPAAPRHDRLVDQPWFTEPGWAHVTGYFPMGAHYLGLHENLMDLSHFPFLHGVAVGKPEHASARPKVTVAGNVVQSVVEHRDVTVMPAYGRRAGFAGPVDRVSESVVPTPAIHLGKVVMREASGRGEAHVRYIVHCPTPETEHSTHYFWAMARSHFIDDKDIDAEMRAVGEKAFREDKDALEAIEELVVAERDPAFRERLIASDEAGVQLLRALARMEREDRAEFSRSGA